VRKWLKAEEQEDIRITKEAMSMFGSIKNMWADAAITSAVEGVIRESSKGNMPELKSWYFTVKKEAYKQSLKDGIAPEVVEKRAMDKMEKRKSKLYQEIISRLSQSGGTLEEINEWLKINNPI